MLTIEGAQPATRLRVMEDSMLRKRSSSADSADEKLRFDIPRRGHVLTTVAENYGEPIRHAVELLSSSLAGSNCREVLDRLLPPPRWQPSPNMVRTDAETFAWSMVSIWVAGVAMQAIPATGSLADAEHWFFGGGSSRRLTDLLSADTTSHAEKALQSVADPSAYYDLLPYILDPHGPGSRLSVRRNPATHSARKRKRAEGVFYTPADVAEYMVTRCLDSIQQDKTPTVFDPACGTGVFLRAALKGLRRRHPATSAFSLASECLFGADIDPWPLDATAFVLLADIWAEERQESDSPAVLWRRLRLNLACIDTLRIDPADIDLDGTDADDGVGQRVSIDGLFPKLQGEPAVIVGNPPYASLGDRPERAALGLIFKTLDAKSHANAEIYLAFLEQMTRLASKEECAGALVLPLSIACNTGAQFMTARRVMQETAGRWRFAFFDREPHALFGEDVKTRNAILLWSRNRSEKNTMLASGPLRKWRGHSRSEMFSNIRFTEFDRDIRLGIPKIDGRCQAVALQVLGERWGRLAQAIQGLERLNLADVPKADDRMVFVGPTAYNFLNVFLRPPEALLDNGLVLSEHPLHAIKCASAKDAFAVFGILTSHLAYWWWHTHGDGFHVSRRFLAEFPFGLDALGGDQARSLSESGASLWSAIKGSPIVSLNRGRTSLAYSPNGHDDMRRCADEALTAVAGLNDEFVDELQQFTVHTVAAKLRIYGGSDTNEKGEGR